MSGDRKNMRLSSWSYDETASYHVTFCVQGMKCVLGKVVPGETCLQTLDARSRSSNALSDVELTAAGLCVHDAIIQADTVYDGFDVGKFAVMPNHVHVLVSVDNRIARATLGRFVGYMKTKAARLANERGVMPVAWQRGYYDHVIRGENDYALTWKYIDENPAKWDDDEYYSKRSDS